ncbi:MAG: histidine phosphatase family protein [Halodesulfurarchaeum sp.]
MTIYVLRHGESIGNERQIVQGQDFDPGLTETGREQARNVAGDLTEERSGPATLRSSPARRAQETATIIGETLGEDIVVESTLREVDPGIIAGVSKSLLGSRFPEYLDVWEARGDLDPIPRAESGDEAQARALLVLDRLAESPGDHIVVSHAAFNRYLLNTARGVGRTTAVGHEPTRLHTLSDPLDGVEIEGISGGTHSEIRRLETNETTYVLKRDSHIDEGELSFHAWVSDYVNSKRPLLPDVLAWEDSDGTGREVLAHSQGEHRYGPLPSDRARRLCHRVADLAVFLRQANRDFGLETLPDRIQRIVTATADPAIAALGRQILEKPIMRPERQTTCVHYDLHRDNLLFGEKSITLLDLSGFCRAPPAFQPASLFMAGFLLEDVSDFALEEYTAYWPHPVNRDRLLMLMVARAYIGVGFFDRRQREDGLTPSEADIHSRYVHAIHRIVDSLPDWSLPAGFPSPKPRGNRS